jgi:hypothetical protein
MGLPVLSCDCLCEGLCEINQLPFLPALFIQPFLSSAFFIQRLFVRRFFEPNAV